MKLFTLIIVLMAVSCSPKNKLGGEYLEIHYIYDKPNIDTSHAQPVIIDIIIEE